MFDLFGRKSKRKRELPFPDGTVYKPLDTRYNIWYIRAYRGGFDVLCAEDPLIEGAGLYVKPGLVRSNIIAELDPLLDDFSKAGRFLVQSFDDNRIYIIVDRAIKRAPDHYKKVLDTIYQNKLRG